MKTVREIFASKAVRMSAIVVGIFLVASASFAGGLAIGLHKAKFSYAFGENYERNFIQGRPFGRDEDHDGGRGMMRGGMMNGYGFDFNGRDFRNGYGISGEVLSVSDTGIVVKDRDNKENAINISPTTVIKNGRDTLQTGDLKAGEKVVVIGKPDDTGTVNADFIRTFGSVNANQ